MSKKEAKLLANLSPEARELYQTIEETRWRVGYYLCDLVQAFIDGMFIVVDGCHVIPVEDFCFLLNDYRLAIGCRTEATTRRVVAALPKRHKPVVAADGVRCIANLDYNDVMWSIKNDKQ